MELVHAKVSYCESTSEYTSLLKLIVDHVSVIVYVTVNEMNQTLFINYFDTHTECTIHSEAIEVEDHPEITELYDENLVFDLEKVADLIDYSELKFDLEKFQVLELVG